MLRANILCKSFVCLAGFLTVFVSSTHADNIVPPPFVGTDPAFETAQEWEFMTAGPIAPDGDDVTTISPGTPMATPGAGVTFTPIGGLFGLDGYIGTFAIGNTITFDLPNIPDNRPIKHLRIQINGNWQSALAPPSVASLTGATSSQFVESDETFPGFHRWEDWDMFPNPNNEQLILTVPVGAFVNQVVIHTISTVPEPSSALLLTMPAIAFALRRRKV